LGEIGDARAIESLISVSRDKDPFVPIYAADALANIGTPAIAPLLAAINDSSSHKRLCAARALGKIGDIRAVQPLIRALKDKVWRVRHHATVSLGDLGDSRAVQPLLTALDVETNYTVQSNILTAIRSIGDTSAVEPLLGMLRRKGKNWDRRWEILTTLGALRDNRAVEAMINVLQDEQERTRARESAADALGAMKDIRAVGILVGLLGQEGLTGSAIWNLGRIGDPNAVEPLIDFMRESQGRSLWQKWTAEALAQIGIPAVQPLLTILNDQEFGVRHNAAKALGEISDQRATHALENAMETKDLVLVSGAYAFFIRRGLPGTETVLIEALSKHGDKSMARDFMLSGNDQLAEAGSNWNAEHGIRLPAIWMGEHEGPRWGEAASKESQ
ncbi:MAG: HEAT repeat domain-containing protein, partial [Candidatus Zixiibacteriota bacterium]